jgi:Tfp pilus assembly protein PilO
MKKKLAALDLKLQFGLVALGLIVLAVAGYSLAVSPQNAKTAKLKTQIQAQQGLIIVRKASARASLHPPSIKVADLFRLARAMPAREDMPGMILTLNQVARSAGVKFDLIAPAGTAAAPPAVPVDYQTERLHLLFHGDFYALSDFLYRLRSLVAVHHGQLRADGRLFNVDTVTFSMLGVTFPQISAEVYVDAYIYAPAPPAPLTTPSTTTPSTTPSTVSPPAGATAAGGTQ